MHHHAVCSLRVLIKSVWLVHRVHFVAWEGIHHERLHHDEGLELEKNLESANVDHIRLVTIMVHIGEYLQVFILTSLLDTLIGIFVDGLMNNLMRIDQHW